MLGSLHAGRSSIAVPMRSRKVEAAAAAATSRASCALHLPVQLLPAGPWDVRGRLPARLPAQAPAKGLEVSEPSLVGPACSSRRAAHTVCTYARGFHLLSDAHLLTVLVSSTPPRRACPPLCAGWRWRWATPPRNSFRWLPQPMSCTSRWAADGIRCCQAPCSADALWGSCQSPATSPATLVVLCPGPLCVALLPRRRGRMGTATPISPQSWPLCPAVGLAGSLS